MVVLHNRIRSTSMLLPEEYDETAKSLLQSLSPDELETLSELVNNKDLLNLTNMLEYDTQPLPVEEWLFHPDHLLEVTKGIYPTLVKDLVELLDSAQYIMALLTGSLGSGKSFFASIALIRMLYEASCLRDPATSYGLTKGSKIGFCILAPSEQVARAAIFEKILSHLQLIPYFAEDFRPISKMRDGKAFRGNMLSFPKELFIVCGSSRDTASLGANIMGGFIDELNFFKKDPKNSVSQNRKRWGEFSYAGRLFDSLMRRIKSRFMNRGKLPGLLIGASSKTSIDSLTEQYIRQASSAGDKKVFVRDYTILELKKDSFSKKKFRVLVGNEYYRSRILEDDDDVSMFEDPVIIEIPEDLRMDFEVDIDSALRDIAGVSTFAISTFITKVEKLTEARDLSRKHPFYCASMSDSDMWDSRAPFKIAWFEIARQLDNGEWVPRLNPHAKRYIHLDPALTGDCFGVCIGHISGLKKVRRYSQENEQMMEEYQPHFVIDMVLAIKGEPGEEIIFRNVRQVIYQFSEHGFHFAQISTDTFQSREMTQQLSAQGYKTKIVSVDESKEPYYYLRRVIYENRLSCYDYEELWTQLRKLEDTPSKVDHPSDGSKDLADALCGVIWELGQTAWQGEPILPQKGISETGSDPASEKFSQQISSESEQKYKEELQKRSDSTLNSSNTAQSDSTVQVYKKRPTNLMPAYSRVDSHGNRHDLRKPEESYREIIIEVG